MLMYTVQKIEPSKMDTTFGLYSFYMHDIGLKVLVLLIYYINL